MTINELIQRLQECGDEKFRDFAKIRIIDNDGNMVGEDLDVFDVKDGLASVDIHVQMDPFDEDEDGDGEDDDYDDEDDDDDDDYDYDYDDEEDW